MDMDSGCWWSRNPAHLTINDQAAYGGGAGQGNYLSIGNGGSVTITFESPVHYFGFQWTAGNGGNTVSLYDDSDNLLGQFDTAFLIGKLPNNATDTIDAIDGGTYLTQDYYGVPGSGASHAERATNNEPFAYIHFVNEHDTPISRIVLAHSGGGAFESDNHTIRFDKVPLEDLAGSPLVEIDRVVPEPSGALLLGLSGTLALMLRRRNG